MVGKGMWPNKDTEAALGTRSYAISTHCPLPPAPRAWAHPQVPGRVEAVATGSRGDVGGSPWPKGVPQITPRSPDTGVTVPSAPYRERRALHPGAYRLRPAHFPPTLSCPILII